MDPIRLMILGGAMVVAGIIILIGGKTDAERDHPDRQMTPLRDQWPFSMLFGRDWNPRSITALVLILLGLVLQAISLGMLGG